MGDANAVLAGRPVQELTVSPPSPISLSWGSCMPLRFTFHWTLIAATLLLCAHGAMAQSPLPVESESRDAAAAFVATQNFMIGRIGRECMPALGRTQTPQQFVAAWQARNARYLAAHVNYMTRRLDEALAAGGAAQRDTVLASYATSVRRDGEGAADTWLTRGERKQACARVVATIESGALDITSRVPMFDELEALANWSQAH